MSEGRVGGSFNVNVTAMVSPATTQVELTVAPTNFCGKTMNDQVLCVVVYAGAPDPESVNVKFPKSMLALTPVI
jgi:hypothetical protein